MVVVTRVAKVPSSQKYDPGLVTLRRSTVAGGLLLGTLLTGWAAGATWLILSKDSFAAHMLTRESARQYVYEDRIAALKSEIDKLLSRQLVDQDSVEARVAELVTRQSQLETRQAIVAALADTITSQHLAGERANAARQAAAASTQSAPSAPLSAMGGPGSSTAVTGSVSSFAPTGRPMPVPEMPGLRRDGGERRGPLASGWDQSALEPPPGIPERLVQVDHQIRKVALSQIKAVQRLESAVSGAHASLRSVISEVGLDPDRIAGSARGAGAQGGPFVPANLDPRLGPFEASVLRLKPRLDTLDRLRGAVVALPLRRPMGPEAEQTSAFGHRLDPFTRSLAMHTGVDFRAETGTPVRSTGAGRVVTAEYSGGYGNMVEVDHGHGMTSRYAHLSHIAVSEGQSVAAGTIVGRVGSTGRSTGPHLHYETRIDGDAVDPQRFLRAGAKFFSTAAR